jgi:exonuclease III
MRIISWNVNGLQGLLKQDGHGGKGCDGTVTKYKRDVIIVGDLNVIPDLELDRRALQYQDGASKEERECFHNMLRERKLVDSFRHLHPSLKSWTWVPPKLWDKHVMGCRIDLVLVDESNTKKVKESTVLVYQGSDHRPIMAEVVD